MKSKRSQEGYLLIDHSSTQGGVFEAPTLTCSHCQKQLIQNMARDRARGYCPKCDHYICDDCETLRVKTGTCRPFTQIIDEFMDNNNKLTGAIKYG